MLSGDGIDLRTFIWETELAVFWNLFQFSACDFFGLDLFSVSQYSQFQMDPK